jgi:hypothetical protein
MLKTQTNNQIAIIAEDLRYFDNIDGRPRGVNAQGGRKNRCASSMHANTCNQQ